MTGLSHSRQLRDEQPGAVLLHAAEEVNKARAHRRLADENCRRVHQEDAQRAHPRGSMYPPCFHVIVNKKCQQ